MANILRKSQVSISQISIFVGQKSILHTYYMQSVKDGIEIQVFHDEHIESVAHIRHLISAKVKQML